MKQLMLALLVSIGCMSCAKVNEDHSCDKYSRGDFTVRVRTLPLVIQADNTFPLEWVNELRAAANTWNVAAGKQVLLVKNSDNKITVLQTWDRANRAEQAYTRVHYIDSGAVSAANIFLNGLDFKFYVSGGQLNEVHLRSLLIHELGHAIGLGHTNLTMSVMYPYLEANVERIKLSSYDKAALECMYGQ